MNSIAFWTVRLIIVLGSLSVSLAAIWTIVKHKLHVKIPMRYLLHISIGQLVMAVCAIVFSVWSISAGQAIMKQLVDSNKNEFYHREITSALVVSRIQAFLFKSSELVSFSFIALFTIHVHLLMRDYEQDSKTLHKYECLCYLCSYGLMLVMAIFPFNGVCYIGNLETQICYFNNVCTIKNGPERLAFFFIWVLPCGVLFLITITFIVKTWWYLRQPIREHFSNKQIMAKIIHQIPIWSFIMYTFDIILTSLATTYTGGFVGVLLDTLQSVPFLMPIPILVAILRYKHYYIEFVLHGQDLSSALIGADEMAQSSGSSSDEYPHHA